MTKYEQQIRTEQLSVDMGIDRYRKYRTERDETDMPPGHQLLVKAIEPAAAAIEAHIEGLKAGKAGRGASVTAILDQLPADVLAYLTLRYLINACVKGGRVATMSMDIGRTVRDEIDTRVLAKEAPALHAHMKRSLSSKGNTRYRRQVMRLAARQVQDNRLVADHSELARVGITLAHVVVGATGYAMFTRKKLSATKTVQVVQATPELLDWISRHHDKCELLTPVFLPMVVKPRPWVSPFEGGYLSHKLSLVKTRNRGYLMELANTEMDTVYSALNLMQDTAWAVNRPVLDTLQNLWDAGGDIAGLPPADMLSLPQKPDDIATNEVSRKIWRREAAEVHAANQRLVSQRVSAMQKLSMGQQFADEEAIYFPHVVDWRGRAYPVVPGLNPQSDDLGRGLLRFAKGKPLGENGAYWLAVHGAGLFGVDKVSFDERVQWVLDHEADILDSGYLPLDGHQFWTTADKPWQALAFCMEWAGYVGAGRSDSYVSHLPVAMDGSCNGLQHFSAVLRDPIGGAAVNLVPAEKPQDIYARVAEVATRHIEADSEAGDKRAVEWVGKVDRSIAKRPVMTLPYGATKSGMRGQVLEEMKKKGIKSDEEWQSASYLADVLYSSIGEVVVAARQAMDWLQEVARVLAKDGMPVQWTTPAGFRVLQEYRRPKVKKLDTVIGDVRYRMTVEVGRDKLDTKRQAQGISPNVVHSWDAAHMMLTMVAGAEEQGIDSWAMVHDSYATHAGQIDQLGLVLRQQFVDMYSINLLEDWYEQVKDVLPPELREQLPPIPSAGTLDIDAVIQSEYFFA